MCMTFVYNMQQDNTEMVLHTILILIHTLRGKSGGLL